MRIIDEITNTEITNPDLQAGELRECVWASPEAYASIDNVTKFALDDGDYETVMLYHRYTDDELEARAAEKAKAEYVESRQGISDEELIMAIAKAVEVPNKPAHKEGFVTTWHYDAATNRVVWTFEPDPTYKPDADGSYLKPFVYVAGMQVEKDKWYTDGEDVWECIKSGTPRDFTDTEFFDII